MFDDDPAEHVAILGAVCDARKRRPPSEMMVAAGKTVGQKV